MRLFAALGLVCATCIGQPTTYTIAGNLVLFRAHDGSAEFEWLSGGEFSFSP